jgi:hypothetical protein
MTNNIRPVECLHPTTLYLYLLSFCPPERIHEFNQASHPLKSGLIGLTNTSTHEFFSEHVPEACRRVVAFHQGSREPDGKLVDALIETARVAPTGPAATRYFESTMHRIAILPERSLPENRLRPDKGCQFCLAACRYGYFTLVANPNYALLLERFQAETAKDRGDQNPMRTAWSFTIGLLWDLLGIEQGYVTAAHLGNLSYCLLVMATQKSRYPFPEERFRDYQVINQELIRRWPGEVRVGEVEQVESGA